MRIFGLIVATLLCGFAQAEAVSPFTTFRSGPLYQGALARPIISTPQEKDFRTRIIEASKQRPNFAGHYSLTTWGCGTGCSSGAVVDSITGQVSMIPFTICCHSFDQSDTKWEAIDFRPDSRLIVFTGQINERGDDGQHYYSFDDHQFVYRLTRNVVKPVEEPKGKDVNDCHKLSKAVERLDCYDAATHYGE